MTLAVLVAGIVMIVAACSKDVPTEAAMTDHGSDNGAALSIQSVPEPGNVDSRAPTVGVKFPLPGHIPESWP